MMLANLGGLYSAGKSELQSLINDLFGQGQQGLLFVPQPVVLNEQRLYKLSDFTDPVTAGGDPAGGGKEVSGNGNHLTQSTSADRPTYNTDGTLHWLAFDGAGDNIQAALSGSGSFLMSIAVRQVATEQDSNAAFISTSNDPSKVGTFQLVGDTTGIEVRDGQGVITQLGPDDTNKHIITLYSRGGTSYGRLDGGAPVTLPNDIGVVDLIKLGVNRADLAYNNHENYGVVFSIDEVSDSTIDEVESYLNNLAGGGVL